MSEKRYFSWWRYQYAKFKIYKEEFERKNQEIFLEGFRAFEDERYYDADRCFQYLIDFFQFNEIIWLMLGLINYRLERTEKACDYFSTAMELNPNNMLATFHYGQAVFQLGDYHEVIEIMFKVLDAGANIQIGEEETIDKRLIYYYIVLSYEKLGMKSTADKYMRKVIEDENEIGKTWNDLGNAFEQIYEFNLAINCYNQACELDPSNYLFLLDLGKIYLRVRNKENALKYLEKAYELYPNEDLKRILVKRFKLKM